MHMICKQESTEGHVPEVIIFAQITAFRISD